MPEYHILLLPRDNYWQWVEAARAYATTFGVNLTNEPDSAGRYMTPQQTVTIAGLPGGYPAQGDIRAWFRQHYPEVRVDYVPAATPAELQAALAARIAANQRFLPVGTDFKLRWPTDYPRVNQGFGENPELYRRWNLPGHEGVDIFAPPGARVYACADGTVLRVDDYAGDPVRQPYGNCVYLQHRDGYVTLYAHLQASAVSLGDTVRAGDLVGLAGATGNASGGYLHLSLRQTGATAAGRTIFPNDFLDPTPHLELPSLDELTQNITYPWPYGYCLVGVHGRADGPMQPADYPPLTTARIEAVKLLTTARPEDVDDLRATNPRMFILVRLYASFEGRTIRPDEFVSFVIVDMNNFYAKGIRYFEVHNEPNLVLEGWTTSWNDGAEFGQWFMEVRNLLKQQFPDALLGFPGLSPGDNIQGIRMRALDFLTQADAAARAADWVGLHAYWVSEQEFNSAAGGLGYLEYRRRFPDKLLFITEFSNVLPFDQVPAQIKGQQYARYYQHLRSLRGLGAAFSFVLSSSAQFANEVWRLENGQMTGIPAAVGARTDVVTGPPPLP